VLLSCCGAAASCAPALSGARHALGAVAVVDQVRGGGGDRARLAVAAGRRQRGAEALAQRKQAAVEFGAVGFGGKLLRQQHYPHQAERRQQGEHHAPNQRAAAAKRKGQAHAASI
jgi:hypothetical protein